MNSRTIRALERAIRRLAGRNYDVESAVAVVGADGVRWTLDNAPATEDEWFRATAKFRIVDLAVDPRDGVGDALDSAECERKMDEMCARARQAREARGVEAREQWIFVVNEDAPTRQA